MQLDGREVHSGPTAPTGMPARIAVLISGGGRSLLNLHEGVLSGKLNINIALVLASRPCLGAERAESSGLPTLVEASPLDATRLRAVVDEFRIDYIVLAGYLRLLPILEGMERRVLNIHPSLLPRFGGPGMYANRVHEAVLAAGDTESGCTVHWCDHEFDRGDIILQRRCPVLPGDTAATLAARVFQEELIALPEAVAGVCRL